MVKNKGLLPTELEQLLISQQSICGDIFLVGGAIRNSFFKIKVQDYDFIVKDNPVKIAKRIADFFHGNYYVMDKTRGTARALISLNGEKLKVDVAQMVGDSINADLSKRDFTINAIAKRIPATNEIIDPLGGESDILNSILRPCSPTSFEDDPVRVIRAVRFINEFDLSFNSLDIDRLRITAGSLNIVSGERKRDEIVNILDKTDVKQALINMLEFGILEKIFPEVAILEKVELDPPHAHNAWEHTLQVVTYCQQLLDLCSGNIGMKWINPRVDQAFREIKKFQQLISDDLGNPITPERSKRSLLLLAGIFHDTGKGIIEPFIKENRKCFPKHAKVSSRVIKVKAREMGFSKNEIDFLVHIVHFHMKPSQSAFIAQNEKDIHIHRFINKVGPAGVLIGLLHLADVLATYEGTITDERWDRTISVVYNIFDAYYFRFNEIIHPPKIIDGNDLVNEFNLPPGKNIGRLLGLVVEAQVVGAIHNKKQAKKFIDELLANEENQGNL